MPHPPGTADPSSGSNRSSQLQTIFDGVELSSPKAEPVAMGRRVTRTLPPPPAPRPMAFSLPAAPVRMGTSVPIAIHRPVGGRWASGNSSDDEDGGGGGNDGGNMRMQLQAGTFIPPHQMSQRDDFMSMIADGQIKRDRLKTRNAVLRSTGFLEPGTAQAATVGLQERQRIATTAAAGGLTQALHPAAQ